MSSILFLGDAHLRERDPEVEVFLSFLHSLPSQTRALYLLGDLFDLWIGASSFASGSQRRVVEALERLRGQGIHLAYVEGNRDYHLKAAYSEGPFHRLEEEGMKVDFGGRRLYLAHGDLVNRRDLQYRCWRRLAKGPILWRLFRGLPPRLAVQLARRFEQKMALTNVRHRLRFPEEECRAFAERRRKSGSDTLVLGHFHREMSLAFGEGGERIEVFVLPSWREERRFLRLASDGGARFESFVSEHREPEGP